MSVGNLAITREALEQFQEAFSRTNPTEGPLQRPERTLRRILKNAEVFDGQELGGGTLSCFISQGFLFTIEQASRPTLVSVMVAREFFKKGAGLEKQRNSEEAKVKEVAPPVDLAKVQFTTHALVRFAERFPRLVNGDCRQSALDVLARATEKDAIDEATKVIRIIKHRFKAARYFRNGECRFVVEELPTGTFLVRTIEPYV